MVNQKNRAMARMMLVSGRYAFRVANARYQLGRGVRALAETHQRLGERLVGVHGDVAGDVVKNVRLGQVIQFVVHGGW